MRSLRYHFFGCLRRAASRESSVSSSHTVTSCSSSRNSVQLRDSKWDWNGGMETWKVGNGNVDYREYKHRISGMGKCITRNRNLDFGGGITFLFPYLAGFCVSPGLSVQHPLPQFISAHVVRSVLDHLLQVRPHSSHLLLHHHRIQHHQLRAAGRGGRS